MPETFRLSDFLPYRLAVLAERVSRRLSVAYGRSHGLTVAEWRVLVHLQRGGEVSIRDIQRYVNLEKPRVSRAVARLGSSGLVRKSAGQGDGRLVSISLTDRGREALAGIIPVVMGIEARLVAGVTAEEMETFSTVLEKIHAALDADEAARPRLDAGPQDARG